MSEQPKEPVEDNLVNVWTYEVEIDDLPLTYKEAVRIFSGKSKGCAMVVADQLFAPILAEVTWIVNHLTSIGEWFYEKVLRGKKQDG